MSPQLFSQSRVLTYTTITSVPNNTSCFGLSKGERQAPPWPLLSHCSRNQSNYHIQVNKTGSMAIPASSTTSRRRWSVMQQVVEVSPESDHRVQLIQHESQGLNTLGINRRQDTGNLQQIICFSYPNG